MRIARASDCAQRRVLLNRLRIVLTDPEDGVLQEAVAAIRSVGEPDLVDLFLWMEGARYATKQDAPYVRSLELRCMPYRDYLQTQEWAEKREQQLVEDGWRCRICNSDEGLQVHHRTYANRGSEQPGDLITLCAGCHRTFHENRQLVRA